VRPACAGGMSLWQCGISKANEEGELELLDAGRASMGGPRTWLRENGCSGEVALPQIPVPQTPVPSRKNPCTMILNRSVNPPDWNS
jgi:hypothetical protein